MKEVQHEFTWMSVGALVCLLVALPFFVSAFPFGGQTQVHHYCYNQAIYALLGPPRGGPYIWTPSTKTYQFGPPSGVGQWLLGLTGPPYYCVVTRSPIFVKEGISIMMMGSSGAAAPAYVPPPSGGGFPGGGGTGGGGTGGGGGSPMPPTPPTPIPGVPGIGLVISEVFAYVDAAHGSDPSNEWVEIYNGSNETLDLSNWVLQDASSTDPLPAGTSMSPGTFLVVSATSSTKNLWTIPANAKFVSLNSSIGNGLAAGGDSLKLLKPDGTLIDGLSWGNNKTVLSPAAPVFLTGKALGRKNYTENTKSAADWELRDGSPGK